MKKFCYNLPHKKEIFNIFQISSLKIWFCSFKFCNFICSTYFTKLSYFGSKRFRIIIYGNNSLRCLLKEHEKWSLLSVLVCALFRAPLFVPLLDAPEGNFRSFLPTIISVNSSSRLILEKLVCVYFIIFYCEMLDSGIKTWAT